VGVIEQGSSDTVIYACKKTITCCISMLQNLVTKNFNTDFWGLHTCTWALFLGDLFPEIDTIICLKLAGLWMAC
jgi:hypothetical protein